MTRAIRVAEPGDRAEILTVVRGAFSDDSRDGQEEIDIVVNSWSLDAIPEELELVAIEDGVVSATCSPPAAISVAGSLSR